MFDSWRALEEDSSVAGTGPNATGRYSWPRSRAVWVRPATGDDPLFLHAAAVVRCGPRGPSVSSWPSSTRAGWVSQAPGDCLPSSSLREVANAARRPTPHALQAWFLELAWASLVAQLVNKSTCSAGDPRLIPWSGRSPGKGHGNPL